MPTATLRPRAASGESDAGAPPSSHSYPASDSQLHAGTTTPSAFSGPFDSPRSLSVALFSPTPQGGRTRCPLKRLPLAALALRAFGQKMTERDERQSKKKTMKTTAKIFMPRGRGSTRHENCVLPGASRDGRTPKCSWCGKPDAKIGEALLHAPHSARSVGSDGRWSPAPNAAGGIRRASSGLGGRRTDWTCKKERNLERLRTYSWPNTTENRNGAEKPSFTQPRASSAAATRPAGFRTGCRRLRAALNPAAAAR